MSFKSTKIYPLTVAVGIALLGFASLRAPLPANAAVTVITTRASDTYIDSYYASISPSSSGLTLASALETRLQNERVSSFSYSSLQTSAFPYTDVDPLRPYGGYIVSFYSGTPVYGYSGMNKEHTWPKSHGGDMIDNDPHMVRPTLTSENSARGNSYYALSGSQGWDPGSFNNEKYRGIAARIIFYGATIGYSEGLRLEDVGFVSGSGNGGKMGKLSDLLSWNLQYPVDQSEIIRNETLDTSLNYNRNPFIDKPDYACRIWGSTNANTQSICAASTVAPTSLTLTPATASLDLNGGPQTLTVNVTPSNASKTVTWQSSQPSIVSVNNGVVTPLAVGSATITATSTVNTAISGTATITVTNQPVAVSGVSITPNSANLIIGQTAILTASVTPSNASNKQVTWSSSAPSVASVNTSGTVTALSLGSANITATTADGGFQASSLITVITQPDTTTIEGSFYNNTTDYNGGDGGVTVANLNNGISIKNALGFNGISVVKTVISTQGYFPRGGGLALGSSSNAGTMTITLNNAYHATSVEATFNDGGKGNTFSSISGLTKGTLTSGTIGTAFSNPSSGTPYVYDFASPSSTIVINTTMRLILVNLVIHYAAPPSPLSDATNWASTFLSQTQTGCEQASMSALNSVWSGLTSSYNALSSEAKSLISGATPNASGTTIEEALARYIVIIEKYPLTGFIAGVSPQGMSLTPANSRAVLVGFGLIVSLISAAILISAKRKA